MHNLARASAHSDAPHSDAPHSDAHPRKVV
jgi:hypothetical protein